MFGVMRVCVRRVRWARICVYAIVCVRVYNVVPVCMYGMLFVPKLPQRPAVGSFLGRLSPPQSINSL